MDKPKELTEREKGIRIIRVTTTRDYLVEGYEQRPVDAIIKDWFVDHNPYSYHAYRDGSAIGFSDKYISHEEITAEVKEEYLKNVIK